MNRNMEAITWALHARGISATAFRLLIQLCSYVNSNRKDFEVWPSHKKVAEAVEISVSGVKRHLAELTAKGFITVRQNVRDNGGKSSNVYRIMVNSQHRMPKGVTIDVGSEGMAQSDPYPIGQSDLYPLGQIEPCPQVTGDPSPQVIVEPCREPLEDRTSVILNDPPTEVAGAGKDLVLLGSEDRDGNSPSGDAPLSVREILEGWNDLAGRCGLATVVKLTDQRKRKALAQARRFSLDDWLSVFRQIEQSSFLRGSNDRGWRVDFNFILSEDNFVKILEGKYGGRSGRPSVMEIGMELARERAGERVGRKPSTKEIGFHVATNLRAARLERESAATVTREPGSAGDDFLAGIGASIGSAWR